MRAQLCLLIANAGTSVEAERIKIAEAVEMLHLATLIHDDVLDQAEIRRGEETIHKHKGNKVAILSGDYLFAKAFRIVSEMPHMEYLKIFLISSPVLWKVNLCKWKMCIALTKA